MHPMENEPFDQCSVFIDKEGIVCTHELGVYMVHFKDSLYLNISTVHDNVFVYEITPRGVFVFRDGRFELHSAYGFEQNVFLGLKHYDYTYVDSVRALVRSLFERKIYASKDIEMPDFLRSDFQRFYLWFFYGKL